MSDFISILPCNTSSKRWKTSHFHFRWSNNDQTGINHSKRTD